MPHSFSVNKIKTDFHRSIGFELKAYKLTWEIFADWVYLVGGITFTIGSFFFLPSMKSYGDTGVWIFIGGSLLYLLVTTHDLIISIKLIKINKENRIWSRLEFLSTIIYFIGTITYFVGNIFYLSEIDKVFAGSVSFIVGSFLFLVGASINVLQITNEPSDETLKLVNGTAVMYISGSLLFLVASIPYLWHGISKHDQSLVYNYVVIEYIVGSILFTLGGLFSMIKTYRIKTELI